MIDPHVHCRDGNESYKETIAHVFLLANTQGIEKIIDMPNTNPPIISKEDVISRFRLVPDSCKSRYYLYVGATSNESQLEDCVNCYNELNFVAGIKMFAGRSVGSLAVIAPGEQRNVYETLAGLGYKGVIAVHCEKEDYLLPDVFNPAIPISHSYARPKAAEIESVKDQIRLVIETGFAGTLHICHVSCPESVELIKAARQKIRITCAVTPHHILWDRRIMQRRDGLIYKMNPPLRSLNDVAKLRRHLIDGDIDWIETDHAPHAVGEKLYPPYLSGYPSMYVYHEFVNSYLQKLGADKELIRDMTFRNICRQFDGRLG